MTEALPPIWLYRLYLLLFALLPWSVEVGVGTSQLDVPAEPLLALTGLGLALALLRERQLPPVNYLTLLGLVWVVWQAVAAAVSALPVVSCKYWLVEAGHWWVFFVGLACWPALWPRLLRWFGWSMLGVVGYTLAHHGFHHFRADQAMLAPMPFFEDHTVYSAVLVLLVLSWGAAGWLALVLLALALAASRAAWLSLALTLGVGLLVWRRAAWPLWLAAVALVVAGGVFVRQKASGDVSSQERLNRYACALRMAAERPWTGFGPGTFALLYHPYQKPEDMTRISRTEPIRRRGPDNYGRGGGAHSEYLQALAEQGWPGLALWLALVAGSLFTAFRCYRRTGALLTLLTGLSLLSFFLHGLVNNFLHESCVAALVLGGMGVLGHDFPLTLITIPYTPRRRTSVSIKANSRPTSPVTDVFS